MTIAAQSDTLLLHGVVKVSRLLLGDPYRATDVPRVQALRGMTISALGGQEVMLGMSPEAMVDRAAAGSCGKRVRRIDSMEAFHDELKRCGEQCECRNHCFSLVLFDVRADERSVASRVLSRALAGRLRTADTVGWHEEGRLGVILPYCDADRALDVAADVCHAVHAEITPEYTVYHHSCRVNPRPSCDACRAAAANAKRLAEIEQAGRSALPLWKRVLDVLGSLVGLLILSPVFVVAGLFIKCVSRGPIFFRQERIGHMGRTFRLWKFRTYEQNTDTSEHEKYLKSLIGEARQTKSSQHSMRKLDGAPGIIPFGNLLRKTCIDEFPQLINVLVGQMSLVGPRPPIGYEVQEYDDWHRGRLCAMPGMTGLWQVSGKNRLSFNEMVRLDIQYLRSASLWLDLKILLKTPIAIVAQIRDSVLDRSSNAADQGQSSGC